MTRSGKIVACLCVFSILLMGCYGSILVAPEGEDRGRMYSDHIEYVVTQNGTKYVFATPPVVVNDTIVGEVTAVVAPGLSDDPTAWTTPAKGTKTTVPIADVKEVYVKELSVGLTILGSVLGLLVVALVAGAAAGTFI